ncbi:MAG: YbaY family lipoprotein [Pseudomonadota bacterium]
MVAVTMAAACSMVSPDGDAITGTVTYRERIALIPGENTLIVRLVDTSKADASPVEISKITLEVTQPPMEFRLPYNRAEIDARHTYHVEAVITGPHDNEIFRNTESYPVLTRGKGSHTTITVQRAAAGASRDPAGLASKLDKDIATIEARLGDYRRIEGSYSAGDSKARFEAFVDRDSKPVLVREERDLGDYGQSKVAFYFRNGDLLRFVEQASRRNFGAENGDQILNYTLKLDFAMGRFALGSKTIDGVASEPDEHEISGAQAQARVARSRVADRMAPVKVTLPSATVTYACADQSRFYASFDADGKRVVVEFLGREPMILERKKADSGFAFGDETRTLRGSAQNAVWIGGDGKDTACEATDGISTLLLAPGDYPVVDVDWLQRSNNPEWTRRFDDLQSAINACLKQPVGELPSVLTAWPMNHGMTGVRTININGGRHDCLVSSNGAGDIHIEQVDGSANILPGEDAVRFTPASGAYPGGKCFAHERLEQNGVFIGWLSRNNCDPN